MKFPAYRKYINDRNFFKILNDHTFEELQVIGSRVMLATTTATQYPEMVHISSLLHDATLALPISEAEYLAVRSRVVVP